MSGTPGPSNTGKAIASLAKMPATDTTRAGTQKMKFIPTLPIRRKKEEVKQEPAAAPAPTPTGAPSERGGGRGQGRGRARGDPSRGGGRAAAPPRPPPPEMTASGPFAMGPSLAGSSAWRSGPRVSSIPTAPRGPPDPAALGANLTKTAAPALKKEERVESRVHVDDDAEVYSDPDEGVEIVDMRNVHTMDWMAPESLKWESARDRSKKRAAKVEKEEDELTPDKGKAKHGPITTEGPPVDDVGDINFANALDLSESEEEEVMENIIDDFARDGEDQSLRQERLYFFQFPSPFPSFVSKSSEPSDPGEQSHVSEHQVKRVSFSADTKPPASVPEDVDKDQPPPHVDGVIGQLEIYKSGAVKMRLANGILLDVTAATQSSFLQQAVHVDRATKNLRVLGEVGRRFVATPDIDSLLEAMTQADEAAIAKVETEGLLPMDTT
ncbi:RNA polymerase III RPC4-domain-containing protein [Lactarius akahatsu]|uniref:RNA polymerase III RPC4-domain-containing protein n=1 Tax=Lactarius akahatsu TaxID=416441 RepID=A0AAD4QF74_9AGAM|nr:RNA polymerase III RPC4-domain-containing protein [Lactarius akahatsu]